MYRLFFLLTSLSSAWASNQLGLGRLAVGLLEQYKFFAMLIVGTAFIAGICFFVAAIFKFKQHKDNPSQITIGTPFAMVAISVALIFLPGFIKPAGESLFGEESMSAGVSGSIAELPGNKPDMVSNIPGHYI